VRREGLSCRPLRRRRARLPIRRPADWIPLLPFSGEPGSN
jgi:hypothetical protein